VKFAKHTTVYVKTLKAHGVVVGVARDGIYKVAVHKLVFECPATDLTALKGPVQTFEKTKPRSKKARPGGLSAKTGFASRSIDLHGLTVDEALKQVVHAVDRAIIDDIERLEIVHGVGTGKLRNAIHHYLSTLSVIGSYKADPGNPGATWVYF
jgi:dsDNA-specific endonuclease/ATPase MutS2